MHLDAEFPSLLKITQPFIEKRKKKKKEEEEEKKKGISNLITLSGGLLIVGVGIRHASV